jgi:hypothetical protein
MVALVHLQPTTASPVATVIYQPSWVPQRTSVVVAVVVAGQDKLQTVVQVVQAAAVRALMEAQWVLPVRLIRVVAAVPARLRLMPVAVVVQELSSCASWRVPATLRQIRMHQAYIEQIKH